jgi:hypothetical protein
MNTQPTVRWTALPIALLAVILAGCAAHQTATGPAAKPPSCRQQYETWKHGAVAAELAKLKSALTELSAQGDAEDLPGTLTALKKAGTAAAAMKADPPPACADPAGYYGKMLARVKAAGDNARSASGLTGIILATAPLKSVPGIEAKLNTELDKTVGKNR